jgi:hypothetical protein
MIDMKILIAGTNNKRAMYSLPPSLTYDLLKLQIIFIAINDNKFFITTPANLSAGLV